jgi:catechol 2,3-dioxygenase-like lactoylglutathione lyase family enzyme
LSRFIGPIRQVGHIVSDLDASLRYWTETVGVGPFFVSREIRFEGFRYMGRPAPSPCVSLAFGQAGSLQIELIAQHDDTPSGYRDFLDAGREGAQHLAAWYADGAAYDEAYRRLSAQGMFVRHESIGPGPRFAYFSGGDGIYPELELAEALLPMLGGFADNVARASEGWTGADPIRGLDGAPERAAT